MLLRGLLVIAGVLSSSVAGISPAYASDSDDDWVTVSGTIWIDENVDGIRQPSESSVPGATLVVQVHSWSPAGYSGLTNGTRADDQGKYRYPWTYPEANFSLIVFYLKPGSGPVKETSWGTSYTHLGHACFYVPSGNSELTLDIRVLHHSNWRVLGGESRTSPPPELAISRRAFLQRDCWIWLSILRRRLCGYQRRWDTFLGHLAKART